MLKLGETTTIADYQKRFVFKPKCPAPYTIQFRPYILKSCFIKVVNKL